MYKKVHKKYMKLLLDTIPGDDDKKIKGSNCQQRDKYCYAFYQT